MFYIILGCIAFGFLYLFDINKVVSFNKIFNVNFLFGCVILAYATLYLLKADYAGFILAMPIRVISLLLAAVAFIFMLYALFISLPFKKTYLKTYVSSEVIDHGMYALCRHPGVIWFFFFYLFLFLYTGKWEMLWACLLWTLMDVIHVWIQDRWFLPAILKGYHNYQKKTPFLIPNIDSIKKSCSREKVDIGES